MKHLILTLFTLHFSLFTSLFASPFAPVPATEVVVYSQESDSPLHVSTFSPDEFASVISREYPPSYTGHRAVCPITRATTNDDFCAWIGGDAYTPGVPFGVSSSREEKQIELTDMSAITPRVNLWTAQNDRAAHGIFETNNITWYSEVIEHIIVDEHGQRIVYETNTYPKKITYVTAPMDRVMAKVSRFLIDGCEVGKFGLQNSHLVVYSNVFNKAKREFLHEGDFLADGALDIDWEHFAAEVVKGAGVLMSNTEVTNVAYKVTFDWDSPIQVDVLDTNTVTKMLSTLITRRFEKTRTIPTPCSERSVHNEARPTFRWKIEGEDLWASQFGTTYTGFKVRVKDMNGKLVYDSDIRRLPAKDSYGVYSWTAPLYVGEIVPGTGELFANLTDYTWEVALYNAKFSMDDLIGTYKPGNPFSTPQTFRMNVTLP